MPRFRRILVATDYSASADRALEMAAALATRFQAQLTVLHVIESGVYAFPFPTPAGLREAARARLDDTVGGLRARLLDASGVLREGIAWEEICSGASTCAADLVVVGSQGRHALPLMVSGSVAERVVRFSPAPVLTMHPGDYASILAGGMASFRHIVAPTDFSDASQRAVDEAVDLALELDTSLTIVHAYELPTYEYYAIEQGSMDAEAFARSTLEVQLARVRARFPNVVGVVRRAAPWQGILDVVKEQRADLIVLSTHGRHGLSRALIGSVAEKIVRLASVPVLTLRAKGV